MRNQNRFVVWLQEKFTLSRSSAWPRYKTAMDRIGLLIWIWPYFYYNYARANTFDQDIKKLVEIKDIDEFTISLLKLIDLHYIASVMSLNFIQTIKDNIFRSHFHHMQMGASTIVSAHTKANSPEHLIKIVINELIYDDITYRWSHTPPFGEYHSFYSIKPILYAIQSELDN